MKRWFKNLNITNKTLFLSLFIGLIVIAVLFACLVPFNLIEIPLGALVGLFIGSLFTFFLGLGNRQDKKGIKITQIILVVRIAVLIAILALDGFVYYKLDFKYFNLFSIVGGYIFTSIIYIFVSMKGGNNA